MAKARRAPRRGASVQAKRQLSGAKGLKVQRGVGFSRKKRAVMRGIHAETRSTARAGVRKSSRKRSSRQIAAAKRNLAGARRKRR